MVAAGAAPLLVVLGHTRGRWASERGVPIVGADNYCAQLVPPPRLGDVGPSCTMGGIT